MIRQIKLIYLDQYGFEFRQGYDAACVIQSIRESLKSFFEENVHKTQYVNIHKDCLSLCQGICAENLFYSEVKDPPGTTNESKNSDEIWLLIKPSKMIKH
mgnify:CR=1 FL=1